MLQYFHKTCQSSVKWHKSNSLSILFLAFKKSAIFLKKSWKSARTASFLYLPLCLSLQMFYLVNRKENIGSPEVWDPEWGPMTREPKFSKIQMRILRDPALIRERIVLTSARRYWSIINYEMWSVCVCVFVCVCLSDSLFLCV